jgi:hypothetical protein
MKEFVSVRVILDPQARGDMAPFFAPATNYLKPASITTPHFLNRELLGAPRAGE